MGVLVRSEAAGNVYLWDWESVKKIYERIVQELKVNRLLSAFSLDPQKFTMQILVETHER